MAPEILVDSNVYIDLLRHRKDPAKVLGTWAGSGNLVICGMIRIEVLRGISSPRIHQKISSFMDIMINVPTPSSFWENATELAWKLDRKGNVIPAQDIIIATCAFLSHAAVLTSDRHFHYVDGLEVITPPSDWFS